MIKLKNYLPHPSLKKADRLILRGFIGPYLVALFMVEFVLVMQFFWKYVDDILGRGYSVLDYLELLGLYGVTILPLALPLTVLLSSVMVYGDLAEHYELSSFKSAGLSLTRLLRPGFAVAIFTGIFSIMASNYFKPMAYEAFLRKFNSMRLSKVTFALEEKIFNMDFREHAIYARRKMKDGKNLEDVLIYNSSLQDKSLLNVISAKQATMQTSFDGKYLIMDLYNGVEYHESKDPNSKGSYISKPDRLLPVNMAAFKHYRKVFQLSDIFKDMSDLNLDRRKHDMLNTSQLLIHIDSLNAQIAAKKQGNVYDFNYLVGTELDSTITKTPRENNRFKKASRDVGFFSTPQRGKRPEKILLEDSGFSLDTVKSILSIVVPEERTKILTATFQKVSGLKSRTWNNYVQYRTIEHQKQAYLRSLNQQYSWAMVCLLFLFVGAPMGTIVRKGGFGYPMLVAIGFYMLFVILTILSERLQRSAVIDGQMGGWLPFLVLLPFALVVTFLAGNDIKLNRASLPNLFFFRRLFNA